MSDKEITPDTFENQKTQTCITDSLPDYLKDHDNFDKIQKALYDVGGSTCTHSEVFEWANCSKCQLKMHERAELMRKLGFKQPGQYLAWKKIHETIRDKKRMAYRKYNS